MQKFKSLKILVLLLALGSCGKKLPVLDGFDREAWTQDRNGCAMKRFAMIGSLKKEKQKLLSLNEVEVIDVLGRPDRNELFKRNQKFYHYFLEPNEECANGNKSALRLSVRFNAMGLAKEVMIGQ